MSPPILVNQGSEEWGHLRQEGTLLLVDEILQDLRPLPYSICIYIYMDVCAPTIVRHTHTPPYVAILQRFVGSIFMAATSGPRSTVSPSPRTTLSYGESEDLRAPSNSLQKDSVHEDFCPSDSISPLHKRHTPCIRKPVGWPQLACGMNILKMQICTYVFF